MHNPIKRVWVPKSAPTVAAPLAAQKPASPVIEPVPSRRGGLFDELPEPEVEEKSSDSIWAEFDSVLPPGK